MLERPSPDTNAVPGGQLGVILELCGTDKALFLHHLNLGTHEKWVWPVCCVPGGGQKCAPSVQGKSLTVLWQWEDAFSTFPACYLNPPSTSLLFLFSTLRWQTVQRFSWVYHKEWKYKGTREPNKCCIECVMNNIRLIWIWALFSVVWWRCLWMLVSKYIQVFWDIIP